MKKCECCGEMPAEPSSNLCARCWRDQVLAMMEHSPKHGYGSKPAARPVMQPKMVICSSCGHKHKRKAHDRAGAA